MSPALASDIPFNALQPSRPADRTLSGLRPFLRNARRRVSAIEAELTAIAVIAPLAIAAPAAVWTFIAA